MTATRAQHAYSDKTTGKNAARPGPTEGPKFLRRGDPLLVYSTDRLGRSMTDVVTTVAELGVVECKSLTEPFGTTTAGGECSHICAPFVQMDGRIISERTRPLLRTLALTVAMLWLIVSLPCTRRRSPAGGGCCFS